MMNGQKNIKLVSSCLSVCPYRTTRLPLDGFSSNFVFEYFSEKIVKKIQVLLNRTRITISVHKDKYTFYITSR